MPHEITKDIIRAFKRQLEDHPVYAAVLTAEELRCFMEYHVQSVWDFMSLIKYLRSVFAPSSYPWSPKGDGQVR